MFWEETLGLKSLFSFLSSSTYFASFRFCCSALFWFSSCSSGKFPLPLLPPLPSFTSWPWIFSRVCLEALFFGDPTLYLWCQCHNNALVSFLCHPRASFSLSQNHFLKSVPLLLPSTGLFLLVSPLMLMLRLSKIMMLKTQTSLGFGLIVFIEFSLIFKWLFHLSLLFSSHNLEALQVKDSTANWYLDI